MLGSQVCFILSPKLLKDLDEYCKRRNSNRSEAIRDFIRKELYKEMDNGKSD